MVITLSQLEEEFGGIAVRATDLTPVMRVGGIMALSEVKSRFDTQTGPDGRPWAPLKFPRVEGGGLPLRNHGLLAASYTSEYGPDFFRVGTNKKGARLHHFGGTVVPVNKQWLTIPLTREAVYAGSAPSQTGLHFVLHSSDSAGLYDNAGAAQWLLVKRVEIPARPQVGVSAELMSRFKFVLVHYLRTGSL